MAVSILKRTEGRHGGLAIGIHRRRLKIAASATAALAGLVFALFLASLSPLFAAKTVDVRGAGSLSRAGVLELAGLSEGTNTAWLSTDTVESALLSSPWVAEATVTRSLPSGIAIEIRERTPVAVARAGGEDWLIAGDGTTLESVRNAALPLLKGGTPGSPGERGEGVAASAAVAAAMDPWLSSQVEAISVNESGEVDLDLGRGPRIDFGPAADLAAKTESLSAMLRWAQENHASVKGIDVRAPEAPAATMRTRD